MDEGDLELGDPIVAGDTVLRPITRRRTLAHTGDEGGGLVARLAPVGVLVERDGSMRALDLDGDVLPEGVLDDLRDRESG
jgi:uncharacterized spore protein YtfJ